MSDYLWDKSGSDPDTELLENQLSEFSSARQNHGFRNPFLSDDKPPFWRDRLLFALVPAFGALLAGVFWFSFPAGSGEMNSSIGLGPVQVLENEVVRAIEPERVANELAKQPIRPPRKIVRKQKAAEAGVRKTSFKPVRKKKALPPVPEPPVLTIEEKEAYSQLIHALSITSSKLRIVKVKAGGAEIPIGSK